MKKHILLAALAALAMLLLVGCGAASSSPRYESGGSPYAGNYADKVEGTGAFVAVVVDERNHALAYVCDGKDGSAAVAEWFTGAVADDGSLDLTSEGGTRLVAEVAKEGASGMITLDGEEHAFRADPAEAPAGLYRKKATVEGEEYLGGWIELANGEERGAVKNLSSGFIDPIGGLARPSQPLNNIGSQSTGAG